MVSKYAIGTKVLSIQLLHRWSISVIKLTKAELANKVDAIVNAPHPTNVQELRSFLGLLNYYGKFIRNLAHPLNQLLQANHKWNWTAECVAAFQMAKDQL